MARDQIIEKLKAEMDLLPIRRESQIVYIMAEIRKVIEQAVLQRFDELESSPAKLINRVPTCKE